MPNGVFLLIIYQYYEAVCGFYQHFFSFSNYDMQFHIMKLHYEKVVRCSTKASRKHGAMRAAAL